MLCFSGGRITWNLNASSMGHHRNPNVLTGGSSPQSRSTSVAQFADGINCNTSGSFDNHFQAYLLADFHSWDSWLYNSTAAFSLGTESMLSSIYELFKTVAAAIGNIDWCLLACYWATNWAWKGDEFTPNTTRLNSNTSGSLSVSKLYHRKRR